MHAETQAEMKLWSYQLAVAMGNSHGDFDGKSCSTGGEDLSDFVF